MVAYIDISEVYGRCRGNLSEDAILIEFLEKINEAMLSKKQGFKGLIDYYKPYYTLADKMLKTWLCDKKVNGFYPS